MATTLIENFKKGIIRNICYFDGIKVKKHFHGNIYVISSIFFSNVSYVIIAWMS